MIIPEINNEDNNSDERDISAQKIQIVAVKELGFTNQIHGMTQLFNTMRGALNPVVIMTPTGGSELHPNPLDEGVRATVESTLISICYRIQEFLRSDDAWDLADYVETSKLQKMALIEHIRASRLSSIAAQMAQDMLSRKGEDEANDKKVD